MKILIIGTPRSGTSSLTIAIGKSLNYKIFSEPFNYSVKHKQSNFIKNDKIIIPENSVLKNIIRQQPKELSNIHWLEFYEQFIPLFDKVILITRIRQDLLLESFLQAQETNVWHEKWVKTHEFKNCEETKKRMEENLEMLQTLSKKYKLPITLYENLYSGEEGKINTILNQWSIPGLVFKNIFEHINPKNKYRLPDNYNKKLL